MSYHLVYPDVDALETNRPSSQTGTPSAETLKVAHRIAVGIIESGIVGDRSAEAFHVVISGHENASHKKTPGYANDNITISVSQK